ncbi:MAG: glycoside hydrolase family 2 TIM barrel-domain containing protein [Bacteroidales bacterium]
MKLTPLLLFLFLLGCTGREDKRQVITLNGSWELAKSGVSMEIPSEFPGRVQVPGLVDMSMPVLDEQDTTYENSVYWYRRTFSVNQKATPVALIKINKARYHTRVYLNGNFVGENTCNFTPSWLEVKPFLKFGGEENELIIAVGCKNNLPDTVTHGEDFEKIKYIPGIYDDVSLILTGNPFISNIQAVPLIESGELRVVAEVLTGVDTRWKGMSYAITELASGKLVARGKVKKKQGGMVKIDFKADIPDARLWSPEDPFLYRVDLSTAGDNAGTRFGMRSFATDPERGLVILNGQPYYMRGTNVCIFRFFEDPERNGLPWNETWSTALHNKFKQMNWNSIRYCIGFPPERWYEIADSLGFLIQDEYPIWTGTEGGYEMQLKGVTSSRLAGEYIAWMRERWNHPCVVIWDSNNESVNDTTGKALEMVRKMDLSNRPWDNGWAAPVRVTDVIETHPYLYVDYAWTGYPSERGLLRDTLKPGMLSGNGPNERDPLPEGKKYGNATIINEYCWLWLNRDGSPTRLTQRLYADLFPGADTPDKRYEVYAKELAKQTEFWRANGTCAGVLHFCGLGYSRTEGPLGFTSDNFIDVENLTFAPYFEKYTRQSFSPVGVTLELWDLKLKAKEGISFPIHVLNDTYEPVEGQVELTLTHEGNTTLVSTYDYKLEALQRKVFQADLVIPAQAGLNILEASIEYRGEKIRSTREFMVD